RSTEVLFTDPSAAERAFHGSGRRVGEEHFGAAVHRAVIGESPGVTAGGGNGGVEDPTGGPILRAHIRIEVQPLLGAVGGRWGVGLAGAWELGSGLPVEIYAVV